MKIYTKTGDQGDTGLFAGPRVSKDHPRIEAYGTVDELNAAIGLVRVHALAEESDRLLHDVQNDLFALGAELATPDPAAHGMDLLGEDRVGMLERAIDRMESELPKLTQFVLPGGAPAAAALHLTRAIARRAERRVVTLSHTDQPVAARVVRYLNRLGDMLFVMARLTNQQAGWADRPWTKPEAGQETGGQ
ncbi:MAG: cob(I)yrinic acid a,c-diamide adenosyltransferase [Pirellulaceae bacterium]|nr:cob(I)yrinic acid a,c-diamide adenosyltransferase [Pirellulaceae bacterium]